MTQAIRHIHCFIGKFNILSVCVEAGWMKPYLVANNKERFSQREAKIMTFVCYTVCLFLVTLWSADLLALLCVMFSCALSLSHISGADM